MGRVFAYLCVSVDHGCVYVLSVQYMYGVCVYVYCVCLGMCVLSSICV